MECFLKKIPPNAREEDVHLVISNALHGGSFAQFGSEPINFELQLNRNKRGGDLFHGGTGYLTLPQEEIGLAFIQRYQPGAAAQLTVNARQIVVSPSNKPLQRDIIERLRRTKYRDPRSEAEKRLAERALELSVGTPLLKIEQGWIKRDSTFAPEYGIQINNNIKALDLRFDDTSRSLSLDICMSESSPLPSKGTFHIKFRYSNIDDIIFDHYLDVTTILFRLRTPVSYEHSAAESSTQLASPNGAEKRPARTRLSSLVFDETHATLAKYISRDVLVRLTQPAASEFMRLCELARVRRPWKGHVAVTVSNIFAPGKICQIEQWISSHKWEVAFQLQKLLWNMLLSPDEYLAILPAIDELIRTSNTEHTIAVLLKFISKLETLEKGNEKNEEEVSVTQCLEQILQNARQPTPVTSRLRAVRKKGFNGDFPCLHIIVTPTRIVLEGPSPEQLNRVLRMYPDHRNNFLRVRFSDEELSLFRWEQDIDGPQFVRQRVGGILRNGITIAGRHFDYLAYSSSALKSHTIWFVNPFDIPGRGRQDAKTIIQALGDFSRDSQFPARMGARIAQAFSSTDLSISTEEVFTIPDIERNGSLFTDGVGTISPEVARQMWESLTRLRKRRSYFLPAAYQVRLGGYKGMLAIDYRLEGSTICVRKSMEKFDSPSLDVEVSRAFDRPGPCFLNRSLIMILETANKIQTDIFLKLQKKAVRDTQNSMKAFRTAAKLLETHGLGISFKLPSLFLRLQNIGLDLENCRSLGIKTVLKDAETDILRELKHRARIPVPDSWKLVGIADEFNHLKEGEIYACLRNKDEVPSYLEGPFLITRSPVIHPGDVQVVRAIGKPPAGTPFDIEPLVNTVVLSCKGSRSLASCLGGGDLDGDLYDLINLTSWPELAPQELAEPAEYPPTPKKCVEGRACNMDDVKDFICDFITSDILGIISVQHLKLADFRPQGVKDPDCIKLAELHSKAVDFPKSGTPVAHSELPRYVRMPRPDWDAGELGFRNTRDEVYPSQRALGQLYRDIQLSEDYLQHKGTHPSPRFGPDLDVNLHARPLERRKYDVISNHLRNALARYVHVDAVPQQHFVDAVDLLKEYIGEMTRICNTYALTTRSILSEEEVVAGTILERTSQRRRRQDMISAMRTASSALVANVRDVLRGSDSDEIEEWMLRSWAAYQVARSSDEFGQKSFGLLALGNVFDAIESIIQRDLFEEQEVLRVPGGWI